MNIQYFEPFSRAWNRMLANLFKPFDLAKWLVVGFTAFLADLLDGPQSNGFNYRKGHFDLRELQDFPNTAWRWLADHPGWFLLIIIGIAVVIILVILFSWLSSRGKFMFLDNVVHNRAEVSRPWHEFKKEGDSLFVWRLIFGIITFAIFVAFALSFFVISDKFFWENFSVVNLLAISLPLLLIFFVVGYISMFLNNFIVPIMYKNRFTAVQAWGNFLSVFNQHPIQFILYGILLFFLYVAFIIFVVIVGFFTCCIGFILVALPYIGSVVTLPISYTFRAFGVEFLEQFGPDYKIFPNGEKAIPEQPS